MKLHHLPRGSKFKLTDAGAMVPPAAPRGTEDAIYKFGAIDGMYSWSIGEDGERYYFAAWTEVELVTDKEV